MGGATGEIEREKRQKKDKRKGKKKKKDEERFITVESLEGNGTDPVDTDLMDSELPNAERKCGATACHAAMKELFHLLSVPLVCLSNVSFHVLLRHRKVGEREAC